VERPEGEGEKVGKQKDGDPKIEWRDNRGKLSLREGEKGTRRKQAKRQKAERKRDNTMAVAMLKNFYDFLGGGRANRVRVGEGVWRKEGVPLGRSRFFNKKLSKTELKERGRSGRSSGDRGEGGVAWQYLAKGKKGRGETKCARCAHTEEKRVKATEGTYLSSGVLRHHQKRLPLPPYVKWGRGERQKNGGHLKNEGRG